MELGEIGLLREDLPEKEPIDLKGWFGHERYNLPLELEIGTGKGMFLLRQAIKVPYVNYIGLEYARKYFYYVVDRLNREGLKNVRLVNIKAEFFLRCCTGEGVFRQIHIYFPDPWPKRRHNRRRLIKEEFLRDLCRVLEVYGLIRIITDHKDYFSWMEKHCCKVEDLFIRLPFISLEAAGEDEMVGSNFEHKYRIKGKEFYGMILKKR
ncbi:MAG TPA: tRNA (guanosine(46)-N7)-methyltransferase TrmB [Candidatus Eremiobacteraeota bacterium]|nr:MAG: tRNA (guanine-N(7)-)-methyltransferase [bacterium ADurb.Bin363]HPZ08836.1 tRNA (guanosine(46)-N7)-methyltransferase TrmB [Candidatus Eremiobacteraeota bacterium]